MALINGYQYITEQEADNAKILCNTHYGIPKSADDITQNWILYNYAELNSPPFWFIKWDETLTEVLGEPTEFEVIRQLPPIS
jgi:hypothetical protein